jgi:hypothetical protein
MIDRCRVDQGTSDQLDELVSIEVPSKVRRFHLPTLIVSYAFVIWAGVYLWGVSNIQNVSVVVGGLVVLWYTWETRELRKVGLRQVGLAQRQLESQSRQIDVQIRPYIIIERTHRPFVIKNIGAGPALNVKVEDVVLPAVQVVSLTFSPVIPVLLQGTIAELEVNSLTEGKRGSDFLAAHLDPDYATIELDVRITYQNVEGKHYSVTQSHWPEAHGAPPR